MAIAASLPMPRIPEKAPNAFALGAYLAQFYMLTPAITAIITRLFFYKPKFTDANLRFGKLSDYFKFWIVSICITALSYVFFTLLGGITWDFTGQVFLNRLAEQFAAAGQDIKLKCAPRTGQVG